MYDEDHDRCCLSSSSRGKGADTFTQSNFSMQEQSLSGKLEQLISKLGKSHTSVDHLCNWATANLSLLEGEADYGQELLYIQPVHKLVNEASQYLRFSRILLLPYLDELVKKQSENHDCRQCAGSCSVRHTVQIQNIQEAHRKMKQARLELNHAVWPSYADAGPDAAYLPLREIVLQLETVIGELNQLEESELIPLILEAQKNIHAHS